MKPVDGWFRKAPYQNFSSLPIFPVHFDFSFRESSPCHTFTLKSSPAFSFKVITKVSFLSDRNLFCSECNTSHNLSFLSTGIFRLSQHYAAVSHNSSERLIHHFAAVSPQLPTFNIYHGLRLSRMLAAAGCCLLMDIGTEGIRPYFRFLCKQWRSQLSLIMKICDVKAAMVVGTLLRSVLKLFLLEGKLIGVYSLELSIRLLGS